VLDPSGNPVLEQIDALEQYRRTLFFQQMGLTPSAIRTLGGGASQFTSSAGMPALTVSQVDEGIFAGDDWRVRPNLTLNLGIRYENQTNISDWRNLAPRIGVA
jgi:outer membrane receptor protein involved in Fe transport